MTVAVLALQGAFFEHQQMLRRLGVDCVLIRNLEDWCNYYSLQFEGESKALIIPGGESTAMMKIIRDEGLFNPIRDAICDGLPVFGTCAGMIMLDDVHLGTMNIHVLRNAYGRQLGSFFTLGQVEGITDQPNQLQPLPMTFIRAPYIESCGEGVEVLSVVDGHIVAARQKNMLVCSFHPELNDDLRFHKFFLSKIVGIK